MEDHVANTLKDLFGDSDNDSDQELCAQKLTSEQLSNELRQELFDCKSKKVYDGWTDKLQAWCNEHNVCFDVITAVQLMEFFKYQHEHYAPTTLWQAYSCLNKYFMIYKGWKNFREIPLLKELLKKYEKSWKKKKAAVLSKEQIDDWLENAPEDAGAILDKAVFIVGFYGSLRVAEMLQIEFKNVNCCSEDLISITIQVSSFRLLKYFACTER